MKVATLNRGQTTGDTYYEAGTEIEYIRKLKFFTTIKVKDQIKTTYTADLTIVKCISPKL